MSETQESTEDSQSPVEEITLIIDEGSQDVSQEESQTEDTAEEEEHSVLAPTSKSTPDKSPVKSLMDKPKKKMGRPRKTSEGDSLLAKGAGEGPVSVVKKYQYIKRQDKNAPPKPVNPYVLFLRKNRDKRRDENPDMPYTDLIKMMATEWLNLPDEEKSPYVEESDVDKKRYKVAMEAYRKSDLYKKYKESVTKAKNVASGKKRKNAIESPAKTAQPPTKGKKKMGRPPKVRPVEEFQPPGQKSKKIKAAHPPPVVSSKQTTKPTTHIQSKGVGDIAIFTDEFLDHNKVRESELKQLRKLTTEYEEQNAILSKHIENMKTAEANIKSEMDQMVKQNFAIEKHLMRLKEDFVAAFQDVPIPGTNQYPTLETLEDYVQRLHSKMMNGKSIDKSLQEKVNQFITKFSSLEVES